MIFFRTSAATTLGKTPASAIALVDGVNSGVLGPGEVRWFHFTVAPLSGTGPVDRSFKLAISPGAADQIRLVTFQVFADTRLAIFYQGDTSGVASLGTGEVMFRPNSLGQEEYVWNGRLTGPAVYYIQLANGSAAPLSYWLSSGSAPAAAAGQEAFRSEPAQVPVAGYGAAPQTALPLIWGLNKGGLEPGQEIWYNLTLANGDEDFLEPLALTMVTTPDNSQPGGATTFDLFTAAAVQNWSPGASGSLVNFGAGSLVVRDNNPWTGERVWAGPLVENDRYYLRVRNGANVHMDYWLFTGDIYGLELGE